jgi:hypothetical protein
MTSKSTETQITQQKNLEQIEAVINALERVNPATKEMIFAMAKQMSEVEIIRSFNQQALDMFTLVSIFIKQMGKEKEGQKIAGYKHLFDNAIKINAKLPIDKFTLIILEFAPEIYEEKEDCFLNMSIPDKDVRVGNEFSIIRSEMFKQLWRSSNDDHKEQIKNKVIPLTTYAHVYLYKTVMQQSKNKS